MGRPETPVNRDRKRGISRGKAPALLYKIRKNLESFINIEWDLEKKKWILYNSETNHKVMKCHS